MFEQKKMINNIYRLVFSLIIVVILPSNSYSQLKPVMGIGYRHYLNEIPYVKIKNSTSLYIGFKKEINQNFNIGFGLQTNINSEEANRSVHSSFYENGIFLYDTIEYCYDSYSNVSFVLPLRLYYNVFRSKIVLSGQIGIYFDDFFRINEHSSNKDFIENHGTTKRSNYLGICYSLGIAYKPVNSLSIECKYGQLNTSILKKINIIELVLNYTFNTNKD